MAQALRVVGLLLLLGVVQTAATALALPLGLLDPLMVATGLLALRLGYVPAVFTGAAAGLIQDGLAGGLIGLHAFAKTAVAAVISSLNRFLVVRGELASSLVVGAAAVAEGLIVRLLLLFLGWPGGEGAAWILGRGFGTMMLSAAFLIGVPRVVMGFRRRRRRPRIHLR